jgi:hypothetical protein
MAEAAAPGEDVLVVQGLEYASGAGAELGIVGGLDGID